jgi:hypothetical protein
MDLPEYEDLRAQVELNGYTHEVAWAETVKAPESPLALWGEYGWVVCNSGMKNQIAERIWQRIRVAVLEHGGRAADVFGHAAKAQAIDDFYDRKYERLQEFEAADDPVAWCQSLPWIGPITKWHLAKNLGVECAKPDRWLERVAATSGESVEALCARLASESGDRVATVDLVIWRACNLGLWTSTA